jgi:hypothetical protein
MTKYSPEVPLYCYKIIEVNINGKSYLVAFLFENSKNYDMNCTLAKYKVSLKKLKKMTGITFNFKNY